MRLDAVDVHVYGGALLIAGGAAVIYLPAGPITLGVILLGLGLLSLRRARGAD